MNFQIVPYTTPARCRRESEPHRTQKASFEGFLRGGGSLRGVRVGAQVAPVGAGQEDEEDTPLLREARKTHTAMVKATTRQTKLLFTCMALALLIITGVFAGLGIVAYRVNSNIADMEALVRPHAESITSATVDMMHDMGGSFTNLKEITKKTKELASISTDPMAQSLNNTAEITGRLRAFLQHPTLQLSLGGDTGTGGRL